MTIRNFDKVKVIAMYQARCTNCGTVEDDYGDWSAWAHKETPVEQVTEYMGWVEFPQSDELICPECQPEGV